MICEDCPYMVWSRLEGEYICVKLDSPLYGEAVQPEENCEGGVKDDK